MDTADRVASKFTVTAKVARVFAHPNGKHEDVPKDDLDEVDDCSPAQPPYSTNGIHPNPRKGHGSQIRDSGSGALSPTPCGKIVLVLPFGSPRLRPTPASDSDGSLPTFVPPHQGNICSSWSSAATGVAAAGKTSSRSGAAVMSSSSPGGMGISSTASS